jgi:hypothetical protein
MQKGERTFPNFLAVPGQTTPGRLTVTKWRFAARPWPENENLPPPLNANCPPKSHLRFGNKATE